MAGEQAQDRHQDGVDGGVRQVAADDHRRDPVIEVAKRHALDLLGVRGRCLDPDIAAGVAAREILQQIVILPVTPKEESRDAVIARLELNLPWQDIAQMTGKSSADAARISVSRALVRLAEVMGDD